MASTGSYLPKRRSTTRLVRSESPSEQAASTMRAVTSMWAIASRTRTAVMSAALALLPDAMCSYQDGGHVGGVGALARFCELLGAQQRRFHGEDIHDDVGNVRQDLLLLFHLEHVLLVSHAHQHERDLLGVEQDFGFV